MKKKILIISSSIILLILVIAYFGVGNYFYNYALNTNKEKTVTQNNPHLKESEAVVASVAESEELDDQKFLTDHTPTSMSVVSSDKQHLKLHADVYQHSVANSKWAIVVHGYNSSAANMVRYNRHFYEKGYNVLAPDLRGHGKSEGDYIGMGWPDRFDMLLWIDKVLKENPNAEIALFGVSMGGATVMDTSGEDLPSNVKVIVEDCGYSSVKEEFAYQLKDLFGLPSFPVLNAANTVTKIRAKYDLFNASSVKQVAKSKTPMLFIHGDKDTFVPYEMLDKVYKAAKVEKEKLVVHGAGHGESEKVDPKLYWNTVWDFVGNYIQ